MELDEELQKHMEIMKNAAIDNINSYVDKVLTECEEFCTIKNYMVIQHNEIESVQEQVNYAIEKNPDYELASSVGKIPCLDSHYWIAVLVHYDFAQKELNEIVKKSQS